MTRLHFMALASLVLFAFVGYSGATVLNFNDSGNLGVTLGGGMLWNGTGGGHLYCEWWDNDDYIYFSSATVVNNFKMTGIPWDGYSGGNIGRIDIHFLNGTTVIYARTINLTGYTTWTNWLTIAINKGNITTIKFDAPGIPPWNNGFWPAIDDLEINNGLSTVVDEFEAYPLNRSSLIEWSTNQESVLLGFELYRSESIEGPFDMVGDLITSHFGSPEGFNYSYKDENLRNKKEYWYQLKVIYSSGEPEYIDPVSVIPGLKKDRINESSSY